MKKEEQRKKEEELKKQREYSKIYTNVINKNSHLFTEEELKYLSYPIIFRDEEVARSEAEEAEKALKERQRIYDFIMQHSDVFPANYYYEIIPKSNYSSAFRSMNYNSIYNSVLDEYNKRKSYFDKLVGDWKADKRKYSCNIAFINDQLFLSIKYKKDTIYAGYISSKLDSKTGDFKELSNDYARARTDGINHSKITKDVIILDLGWYSGDGRSYCHFYYKNGVFILDNVNDSGGWRKTYETITFTK